MKIGDLYRVKIQGHTDWQLGDLIVITRFVGGCRFDSAYVEGMNTKTGNRHHYLKDNLEKLCKGEI